MSFDCLDRSIDLIAAVGPALGRLRSRDRDLADQLARAASSVPLNVGEGRRRAGKDRLHSWRIAAGSAEEVRTGLRVAVAWGHLAQADVATALTLCDRVLAMLWRMTR